jgi:hypothetical protein
MNFQQCNVHEISGPAAQELYPRITGIDANKTFAMPASALPSAWQSRSKQLLAAPPNKWRMKV